MRLFHWVSSKAMPIQGTMQINQASTEFVAGYFSTHNLSAKTKVAYCSDLAQFRAFAGEDLGLLSLGAAVVENWAAHLRKEGYSPASMRRKMVTLRVFCSYWVRKGTLPESPFWRVKLSFGRIEQRTEGVLKAVRSRHVVLTLEDDHDGTRMRLEHL